MLEIFQPIIDQFKDAPAVMLLIAVLIFMAIRHIDYIVGKPNEIFKKRLEGSKNLWAKTGAWPVRPVNPDILAFAPTDVNSTTLDSILHDLKDWYFNDGVLVSKFSRKELNNLQNAILDTKNHKIRKQRFELIKFHCEDLKSLKERLEKKPSTNENELFKLKEQIGKLEAFDFNKHGITPYCYASMQAYSSLLRDALAEDLDSRRRYGIKHLIRLVIGREISKKKSYRRQFDKCIQLWIKQTDTPLLTIEEIEKYIEAKKGILDKIKLRRNTESRTRTNSKFWLTFAVPPAVFIIYSVISPKIVVLKQKVIESLNSTFSHLSFLNGVNISASWLITITLCSLIVAIRLKNNQ